MWGEGRSCGTQDVVRQAGCRMGGGCHVRDSETARQVIVRGAETSLCGDQNIRVVRGALCYAGRGAVVRDTRCWAASRTSYGRRAVAWRQRASKALCEGRRRGVIRGEMHCAGGENKSLQGAVRCTGSDVSCGKRGGKCARKARRTHSFGLMFTCTRP